MIININELPVVALSYDEPNCEENWKKLLEKRPDAQRIHGIKGHDLAFKLTAQAAKSKGFQKYVLVELDTEMYDEFWNFSFETIQRKNGNFYPCYDFHNVVYHNGCVYCYGATKVFDVDWVLNMESHDNGKESGSIVDFPLEDVYTPIPQPMGVTHVTSNPTVAFRSGFREGMKLGSLAKSWMKVILVRWLTVGSHVENGIYSIIGCWHGLYNNIKGNDIRILNDYEKLNSLIEKTITKDVEDTVKDYMEEDIHILSPENSKEQANNLIAINHGSKDLYD